MKKILFATGALFLFGLVPLAFAQGFVPLAPIPGLTQGVDTTSGGLLVFFNNLYKYAIGLSAVLAIIMIIWGGLEYSTQDSVSKKSDGKERILQAIFGLVLVLSPVLVFSIINPSILNLSLNLPELKTAPGTVSSGTTGGTGTQASTTVANNVTQNVTGTYLQTARFSSNSDANNNSAMGIWRQSCIDGGGIVYAQQNSSCSTSAVSGSTQTCTSASDAIGLCAHFSSTIYNFIDVGTWYSATKLQALGSSASAVSEFRTTCASDGGYACAAQRSSDSSFAPITFKKLGTCPEPVTGLPGNASGDCYQANLLCSKGTNTRCQGSTTLYP